MTERTKILITVMTYPHPSRGYRELVCTAGVTESGEWVRLYPIDYRHRPRRQMFRKYQWIEVDLEPPGSTKDSRKESRRPDLDSIRPIGEPIGTRNQWRDRREWIDRLPHRTLKQWQEQYETDKTSLGVVRPVEVSDMIVSKTEDPDWKPEWRRLFEQRTLFGPPQKPLRKLPYKFQYVFKCEDDGRPHKVMCEDWELGALFLKESDRLGSDKAASESVREKFLNELCGPNKDTRFFMGTRFPYNTWLVLGVFWPPRRKASPEPPTLFTL